MLETASVEEDIDELPLEDLDMTDNRLESLPMSIGHLPRLRSFWAAGNQVPRRFQCGGGTVRTGDTSPRVNVLLVGRSWLASLPAKGRPAAARLGQMPMFARGATRT